MKNKKPYEQLAKQLLESIEAGNLPPWNKPWKASAQGLPHNFKTGKAYRGYNLISLMLHQAFTGAYDSRYLTFLQAKELGFKVKKGSMGNPILFYTPVDLVKEIKDEEGKTETVKDIMHCLRGYVVFNACYIEGIPALETYPPKEWEDDAFIENLAHRIGVKIEHKNPLRAFYSLDRDIINMPPKEAFKGKNQYYLALIHELAHATGAPRRLNRSTEDEFGNSGGEYAREELRAEITTYMIALELGISNDETNTNALSYLKGWAAHLQEKPKELYDACQCAQKIKDYLLSA